MRDQRICSEKNNLSLIVQEILLRERQGGTGGKLPRGNRGEGGERVSLILNGLLFSWLKGTQLIEYLFNRDET